MKNNFITKIIGATLVFAMMIGGSIGFAKGLKPLFAADGDSPIVLDASTMGLNSTATSSAGAEKTYGGIKYMVASAKSQAVQDGAENNFTSNATMLIGKTGAFIYNKDTLPGTITKLEIYANKGASAKVSIGVSTHASSAIISAPASWGYTQTLSTLDHVYDASAAIVSGAKFFRYQVTNNNNSKVQIRITYAAGGGSSSSSSSSSCSSSIPTTYTVTYANGGATSGNLPEDNTQYEGGATVTVLGNTGNLAKTGYTFGGWTDGNDTYSAGDTFEITADTTLTAVWVENTISGTFNKHTGALVNGDYILTYGSVARFRIHL